MNKQKLPPLSPPTIVIPERDLKGHELFKALIKDGCEWQGDVFHRKWSEALYITPATNMQSVETTLKGYIELEHYLRVDNMIYIA